MNASQKFALVLTCLSFSVVAHAASNTSAINSMSMDAPMLQYSAVSAMNMMMSGKHVEVTKAPGYRLVSQRVSGHTATLVYAGTDAKGLFGFYSKAIAGEGWMEDMNMKMGQMKTGEYGEAYIMKAWKLDLMTLASAQHTTVTIKTH